MKGLIYKDFMLLGKQARLLLVMIIGLTGFWTWTGDTVTGAFSFSAVIVFMLSMNCFAYDELAGYDKLVASAPIPRKQVVMARYLSSLMVWAGTTAVSLICMLAVLLVKQGTLLTAQLVQIAISVPLVLALVIVLMAVWFPIFYKFGVNKSRLILILVCALGAALLVGVITLFAEQPISLSAFTGWNQVLLPLLAVAVLALILSVSYSLCVRILEKKEY